MHILLKKTANYKGILIITHKEFPFILKHLDNISINYYIFCHYGFNVSMYNNPKITYNMITDSRCKNNKCIPFTSRNFLSTHFNNNSDIKIINENIKVILQKNNIDFYINLDIKNFNFIINTRAP